MPDRADNQMRSIVAVRGEDGMVSGYELGVENWREIVSGMPTADMSVSIGRTCPRSGAVVSARAATALLHLGATGRRRAVVCCSDGNAELLDGLHARGVPLLYADPEANGNTYSADEPIAGPELLEIPKLGKAVWKGSVPNSLSSFSNRVQTHNAGVIGDNLVRRASQVLGSRGDSELGLFPSLSRGPAWWMRLRSRDIRRIATALTMGEMSLGGEVDMNEMLEASNSLRYEERWLLSNVCFEQEPFDDPYAGFDHDAFADIVEIWQKKSELKLSEGDVDVAARIISREGAKSGIAPFISARLMGVELADILA